MVDGRFEEELQALERAHGHDRDGGLGLVDSIVRLWESLDAGEQDRLAENLLEKAATEQPGWWGVALEALTRKGSPSIADRLIQALEDREGPTDWRDMMLRSILSIGGLRALEKTRDRIEALLYQDRLSFLTLLMQVFPLDPDLALAWGGQFLARLLGSSASAGRVRGYIPGLVTTMARVDPELPLKMKQAVSAVNPDASERFSSLVLEYLKKPWALEWLDRSRVNRLAAAFMS